MLPSQFEEFLEEYECSQYETLPKFIMRRVDALKKLQLEHIKLQHQYFKRLQELELEFDKLHKPLYEKRAQIISGEYEPTDEECQLPANIAENEFNGDQENAGVQQPKLISEEMENSIKDQVKGLPGFWLGCLNSTYNFSESIEKYDRKVLKYLRDVRLSYDQTDDLSYKLEFFFDENPYFTNNVLTKTYYMKSSPDEKNPFTYEGFEVYKSEGCEINWKEGKDVTTKIVTVKQRNKKNGVEREKKKEKERDSFFYFFKPPQVPENGEEDIDEELSAVMAVDFELGELIRQSLIPRAVLYYTGYMSDEDDDDDEADDDDEDSDGFDLDSDLDNSNSEDGSHDSDDSLVKKEAKKNF